VVFLTALDDVATHERALNAGVDGYLTKPLRTTELLIRVRSLLRLGQAMTSLRTSHALVSAQRDELIRGRDLRRQLSTFVVHDLKSPLSMIVAATQMVQRKLPCGAGDKLQIVQRAAHNMLRMVHHLLDIARSEDSRLIARPTDIDRRAHRDRGDAQQAGADAHRPRRRARHRCRSAAAHLRDVRAPRRGHFVRVGHGLGLVFCRLAIEAQGGRIWVEGGENERGAAFHAVLPVG
jgi:two-component system sensor histidine kinase/response regulator